MESVELSNLGATHNLLVISGTSGKSVLMLGLSLHNGCRLNPRIIGSFHNSAVVISRQNNAAASTIQLSQRITLLRDIVGRRALVISVAENLTLEH